MPARVTPPGAPPRPVREVENAWIPLADGTRLAARLWLPEDAAEAPVPAILEYIPYCKRDGTAARDEAMHPYFAAHGYAAVRVDLRGSGESDGLLDDEYLARELDDGLEVIAWIARQPWCGGRVGMIGKSWGGFNALQVAALRPPALACIITVDSTDDRYADDVHYMGGCLNVSNLTWAFSMFGRNARPPDPAIVGERWREMWRTRLENNRPWVVDWLRHQRRDAYWQHGSVCQDYGAIVCPVYAIGGWADAYSNAVPRLIAGLTCPRKALIGPWGHQYPHQGSPGPAIGFLQEALRWWDHWLNDRDSGIMDEPVVRVWMQDYGPPRTFQSTRPGRWITAAGWPPESVDAEAYALNPRGLHREAAPRQDLTLASPQTLGAGCISWINSGAQGALEEPSDQREDDAQSLAFDSAPLEDAIEILGAPVVELDLTADRPNALVCARLCEVAPNGASTRVSYGLLNLTHRDGHADPTPLRPGETLRARVRLNDIAHRFSAGHRIRVSLSTAYWPIIWPSPEAARLTIHSGASTLILPVRRRDPDEAVPPDFPPPESAPLAPRTTLRPAQPQAATIERDMASGRVTVRQVIDGGKQRIDSHGWEHGSRMTRTRAIEPDDPLSARVDCASTLECGRAGGPQVRIEATTSLTADRARFHVEAELQVFEDERPVFSRTWREAVPRDLV